MPVDLAAEREERAWADAARLLRQSLAEFADQERFTETLGAAAAVYWNDYYNTETLPLMSLSESERFLDWFIFDYQPADSDLRTIEMFRAEFGGELNSTEKTLLDHWIDAGPMSGYELTGYERQTLFLKEVNSGTAIDVFEPAGHGNAPIGSWILGRLVPVNDRHEFFALPAFIPPEEITDLPEKLAAARQASDGQSATEFMRRHNVLLIHHALEQARLAGRPPVARLDPNHVPEGVPQRQRHQRQRIKGPATQPSESLPHMAQTRRKAI
jgi:hypothetical protein